MKFHQTRLIFSEKMKMTSRDRSLIKVSARPSTEIVTIGTVRIARSQNEAIMKAKKGLAIVLLALEIKTIARDHRNNSKTARLKMEMLPESRLNNYEMSGAQLQLKMESQRDNWINRSQIVNDDKITDHRRIRKAEIEIT